MSVTTLFERLGHRNVLLEDSSRGEMIQSNQHLVIHGESALLVDPGGHKVFPRVLAQALDLVDARGLEYLFCSHQDPDIVAALNGWMIATEARVLVSSLWLRFIPHFGVDSWAEHRIEGIPDEGMILRLGGAPLVALPAHFLHSCGNFQLYDPTAKILYSGDLGASLGARYQQVTNFDDHIRYMEAFHQRYMGSNAMLRAWARMVRKLDIETIAPQHGAYFVGRGIVERFIVWCEELRCGMDLFDLTLDVPDY